MSPFDPKAEIQRFLKPRCNSIAVTPLLGLGDLRDAECCTKTFSYSYFLFLRCQPIKERGMEDYRLDEVEEAAHHPKILERLTAAGFRSARGPQSHCLPLTMKDRPPRSGLA
jgi:hypothetical protein